MPSDVSLSNREVKPAKKPMKVLFVLPGEPFPRDYNMASALKSAGHQVEIIYWKKDYDSQMLRLCTRVSPFTSGGTELRKLFLQPAWILFVSIKAAFSDFDLVQARNLPGLLAALPVAKIRRSRIIYDLADFTSDSAELVLGLPRTMRRLISRLENHLVQMTDALLVVSEGQLVRQIVWPRGKPCSIVYNTTEPVAKASSLMNSGRLEVLYAGGLSKQRVPGILAVAQAVRRIPNAHIKIAGYEISRGISREISKLASTSSQIEYLGFVPHAEVIRLTSSCDCVVDPIDPLNPNCAIAIPNKLLEAMASGKPILISKGTLGAEIVDRFQCGIAIRYGDTNDAELALQKVCDPVLRERLGSNGRRAFEEKYSWEIGSRAYLQLCEALN